MKGSVSHYTFTKDVLAAVAAKYKLKLDTDIALTVFCLDNEFFVAAPQLCKLFGVKKPSPWVDTIQRKELVAYVLLHMVDLDMNNRVKNFFNRGRGSIFLKDRGIDSAHDVMRYLMHLANVAMRQRQVLRVVPKEKEEAPVSAGRKTRRVQQQEDEEDEAEIFYPSTSESSNQDEDEEPEPRDESRRKASPPRKAMVEREPSDEEVRLDVFLGEQMLPAFVELRDSVQQQVRELRDSVQQQVRELGESLVPTMRELTRETINSAGCTFTALNSINYQNTDAWKRRLDQEVKEAAASLIAKKVAEHAAAMDKQLAEHRAKCDAEWRALEAQRANDVARGRSEGFAKGHDEGYAEGKRVGYAKGLAEGEVQKLRQMGLLNDQ